MLLTYLNGIRMVCDKDKFFESQITVGEFAGWTARNIGELYRYEDAIERHGCRLSDLVILFLEQSYVTFCAMLTRWN